MLTIKVNGKPITISDIMAGVVVKHHDDRYSLKIGFAVDTILTEYERECVGRKLADLAAENERLKGKLEIAKKYCPKAIQELIDRDGDAT